MAPARVKRLVIDASVAQSCGGPDSVHPTAARCRDFLLAVLQVCHRVVMPKALRDQWRDHRSWYSSTWLTSMFARKKVQLECEDPPNSLEAPLRGAGLNDEQLTHALGDRHLVEAALSSDRIVVSRDNNARAAFRQAAGSVAEIRNITWVNPEEESDPRKWLEAGGPADSHRLLGA